MGAKGHEDDRRFIEKTHEDDRRFIEWWESVSPRVMAIGKHRLGSEEAAQDLAQDVAEVAYLKFRSSSEGEDSYFTDRDHFQAWVLRRAKWLALDHLRRQQRHP